jgi:hypothetical protein
MKLKISFGTPVQRLARWEKIKQGGIWRFVFMRGVLGWGLSCGVFASAVDRMSSQPNSLPWYLFVPLVLGLFLIGGIVWGLVMWFITMWAYSRALKSK